MAKNQIIFLVVFIFITTVSFAQKKNKTIVTTFPNSIPVVGIVKNLSDSALIRYCSTPNLPVFLAFCSSGKRVSKGKK